MAVCDKPDEKRDAPAKVKIRKNKCIPAIPKIIIRERVKPRKKIIELRTSRHRAAKSESKNKVAAELQELPK
jgi:hypothetical protein